MPNALASRAQPLSGDTLPASGPLPDDPIPVGPKTEVGDNRIYVGAWTRIVVRRATDEEIAAG